MVGNLSHVSFYLSKIESMNIKDKKILALLAALKSLVQLDHNNHKAAARSFLEINYCLDDNEVLPNFCLIRNST